MLLVIDHSATAVPRMSQVCIDIDCIEAILNTVERNLALIVYTVDLTAFLSFFNGMAALMMLESSVALVIQGRHNPGWSFT